MPSVLIKNARIVTMNKEREILQGDLLTEDDRIACIGRGINGADVEIDAQGGLLTPGLIQTHIHLCQTLFRGMADDLELLDWLRKRIWPLEGAHDEESVYYSALLGIGELFACGTTSIIDMETVHHTGSAFQAISEAGIRAISGKCMMDWGSGVPETLLENTNDSLQESSDLCEKWNDSCNGRIKYAFAPRFAVSCSGELLKKTGELSRLYGVKVHSHASENNAETKLVESERGMRNIKYFNHLGMADENLILAHCIWLDKEEMEVLAKNRVNAVHCPSSNLKLASGVAKVPDLLEMGVNVSIGADGAPCNNNLDIFNEMRLAALIHKPVYGPTAMTAQTVFEMATLYGAKAMGLSEHIGSLEVGKKADLVLIRPDEIHCAPVSMSNVYAQLVYQLKACDVAMTMVDGRIVYKDGGLETIDEADCKARCEKLIGRVFQRAGI